MTSRKKIAVILSAAIVIAVLPAWNALRVGVSDTAVKNAERAVQSGDADAAVDFMNDAVDWDPNNAAKRSLLGNALLLVNQPYDAAFELKKAMKNPNDPNIAFNLGVAYSKIGNRETADRFFDEAERRYRSALAKNPKDAMVMYAMGRFYLSLSKRREALDCFIKAAMLAPENPAPMLALERLREIGLTPGEMEGGVL